MPCSQINDMEDCNEVAIQDRDSAVGRRPAVACPTTAAQLGGRITDQTGAVVADATVVVTNSSTGIKTDTSSNDQGNFTAPLLEPGTYEISVEKTGFRPVKRSGIILHVNQTARIDFKLELGAVSESISVNADAPLLRSLAIVSWRRGRQREDCGPAPQWAQSFRSGVSHARRSGIQPAAASG